jgi:hypothetical protein
MSVAINASKCCSWTSTIKKEELSSHPLEKKERTNIEKVEVEELDFDLAL